MRIVVFTSNMLRHKFLANCLTKNADDALVISECRQNDAMGAEASEGGDSVLLAEHFRLRYETEQKFFQGNDFFLAKTLPVLYGEANLPYVYESVKKINPQAAFVFGSCIIKKPLLSLIPEGKFINLHLGLSPYYRGSGTNFWPFVNNELEYVGSTILHIDAGVDTGDIISHVRPSFKEGDNVHTVGCKVIKESTARLMAILDMLKKHKKLNRTKQWKVSHVRYYRATDFDEKALARYKRNLKNGIVEEYIKNPKQPPILCQSL